MRKFGFFLVIIAFFSIYALGNAQLDYKFFTGAKKGELDTLARELTKDVVKETTGLLEKEIDPDKYIVGPYDEFSIGIMAAKPKQMDIKISPDGKLLIPTIGAVNLKGKKLSEAYNLIKEKIQNVYRVEDIDIVLKDVRKFKVSVTGAVLKPNIVPATAADRVSEIIERAGGLKYDASIRNIYLIREGSNSRIKVDLLRFFLLGESDANPFVLGGDNIIVPPNSEKNSIAIYGDVASPGEFEYVSGDSLSTLIRFSMGFLESASLDSVEIARFRGKALDRFYLNLSNWKDIMNNNIKKDNDFALEAGDRVYIRSVPKWKEMNYVVVTGEVNYPGKYAIDENKDRLSDLMVKFGGFTPDAGIEFIEFIRQSEKEKPDEEMERLYRIPASEMSESELRYFQARKSEKRGAMAIDFRKILNNPSVDDNIVLINKDSIIVPSNKNFINIQGRVVNPGMIIYKPNMTYLDYINKAGGFAFRADESETVVNKPKGGQFLAEDMNYSLEPGDVILVPPQKEVTFMEAFTTSLTVVTQLLTIAGVVLAFVRL